MTQFTDDDLKRVKGQVEAIEQLCDTPHQITAFGVPDIKALLARLEAAEKHIEACIEFHGTDNNDGPSLEAWRRAKGEEDSKAAGK